VKDDFRMRGLEMTRIEVFVDAAFAFAVTLLVISFDAIPRNWNEVVVAIKSIPAFAIAAAQLVWLWYEHSVWSKRFGLDDGMTVFLSGLLLVTVLVYIYPLRIMIEGMVAWFTSGYLPQTFQLESYEQLAGMFVFLGISFAAVCLVFTWMNFYAAGRREQLLLSDREHYLARSTAWSWSGSALIGLVSAVIALLLPIPWTPFAGFTYFLLGVWIHFFLTWRYHHAPE
jgi:hypothetical protein